MLRTAANTLATGLLFLGLLHSLEVIAPGRAIDGKRYTISGQAGALALKCFGGGGEKLKCGHADWHYCLQVLLCCVRVDCCG